MASVGDVDGICRWGQADFLSPFFSVDLSFGALQGRFDWLNGAPPKHQRPRLSKLVPQLAVFTGKPPTG
jgi:hypothetical protein